MKESLQKSLAEAKKLQSDAQKRLKKQKKKKEAKNY